MAILSLGTPKTLKAESKIRAYERALTLGLDHEQGAVFTEDGKQILEGRPIGSTKIEFEYTREELRRMEDGVATHTHPGGTLFSKMDLELARDLKLREIRAVADYMDGGKAVLFRIQRPDNKAWPGIGRIWKEWQENVAQLFSTTPGAIRFDQRQHDKLQFEALLMAVVDDGLRAAMENL